MLIACVWGKFCGWKAAANMNLPSSSDKFSSVDKKQQQMWIYPAPQISCVDEKQQQMWIYPAP